MRLMITALLTLLAPVAFAQDCSTADHTAAIQYALDTQSLVVLGPSLWCVNGVTGLNLGSNTTLIADGATLQIRPGCAIPQVCKILQTRPGATNWRIRGGLWLGDLTPAIGFSIGIRIDQAEDGIVEYVTLRNWRSDGLQITGNSPSRRIELSHITSEFAVRNGISVVNADDVTIHHSVFQDVTGNNPGAAIDVEPNAGGVVNNLLVFKSTFRRARVGIYDQKGQGLPGANHTYVDNLITDNWLIDIVMNCVVDGMIHRNTVSNSPLGITVGGFAAPQNCQSVEPIVIANRVSGATNGIRFAGALRPIAIGSVMPGPIQSVGLGTSGDTVFLRNIIQ